MSADEPAKKTTISPQAWEQIVASRGYIKERRATQEKAMTDQELQEMVEDMYRPEEQTDRCPTCGRSPCPTCGR